MGGRGGWRGGFCCWGGGRDACRGGWCGGLRLKGLAGEYKGGNEKGLLVLLSKWEDTSCGKLRGRAAEGNGFT